MGEDVVGRVVSGTNGEPVGTLVGDAEADKSVGLAVVGVGMAVVAIAVGKDVVGDDVVGGADVGTAVSCPNTSTTISANAGTLIVSIDFTVRVKCLPGPLKSAKRTCWEELHSSINSLVKNASFWLGLSTTDMVLELSYCVAISPGTRWNMT